MIGNGASAEFGRGGAQIVVATRAARMKCTAACSRSTATGRSRRRTSSRRACPNRRSTATSSAERSVDPIRERQALLLRQLRGNAPDRLDHYGGLRGPTAAPEERRLQRTSRHPDPIHRMRRSPATASRRTGSAAFAREMLKFAPDPNSAGSGAAGSATTFVSNYADAGIRTIVISVAATITQPTRTASRRATGRRTTDRIRISASATGRSSTATGAVSGRSIEERHAAPYTRLVDVDDCERGRFG